MVCTCPWAFNLIRATFYARLKTILSIWYILAVWAFVGARGPSVGRVMLRVVLCSRNVW